MAGTQRLHFILDGDDNLSRVLNRAGDSSARLHRRLNDDMDSNNRAVTSFVRGADGRLRDLQGRFVSTADSTQVMQRSIARFTQDADGRMRDLRGRFLSVSDANRVLAGGLPDSARRMDDITRAATRTNNSVNVLTRDSSGRLRDLRGRFASAGQAAGLLGDALPGVASNASSAADSSMGLMGALKGVAVVAGISLLPALGAVVPMIAGLGVAAGTLKMGFSGVGEAMAASGQGHKEYAAALKKLSPPARDFTKALVGLKKEFGPIGKEIQKAMLPGFTRAVKDAAPVVKILGRAMGDMGKVFGDAAAGVGRLLKDSGFQSDLQTNFKLGAGFVKDMTTAMGPFVKSLLDFGAASGPTLKAFSDGLGGLLSKGLPQMFDGLKNGIPGTAKMLDGLFSAVNNILPALGRLGGEFGKTLGPVLGQSFKLTGDIIAGAMDTIRGAIVLLRPVFRDIGFGLKAIMDVGRIVGPTLADAGSAIVTAFLPVSDSVSKGIGPLQKMNLWVQNNKVTVLEWGRQFGVAMITITSAAIKAAPVVIKSFKYIAETVLTALGVVVSGAAKAFGWIPGIGGKLKSASKAFDAFKDGYIHALDVAGRKADAFAASAGPKLSAGKLRLNINNWQSQIEAAKAKLKTVPPEKRAALKAQIADLEAKVRRAKGDLASLHDKTVTLTSIHNVITRSTTYRSVHDILKWKGGPAPRFANGGMPSGLLQGPGTGTSDSIPMWWASTGEYIVNAKSTAKHLPLIEAINKDQLGTGSGLPGAGSAVAAGLAQGMTGSTGSVDAAARTMAAAVVTGIKTELQIASPSKKTRALAKDIGKGLIVGLTGTRDKIKSTAKDLANDIKTAFSGKKESSLLRMVDRQTKKLLSYASQRDKIAAKIAEAKQYAKNTTQTARSSAALSNLGMDADHITAGGIKAGLASKLAQIKQFSKYISTLAKRGLNKHLLRQILDMGPVDGYAYASALVGADKGTLSAINKSQKAIDSETTKLGRKGADILYDSGKNAGKGFLAGLQGQKKHIEKLMMDIAKGMQKAIRKALGIKSPSTVMAKLGAYSTQGLARGLVDGIPALDQALDVVSGRMAGTRPVIGMPAAAGSGGGQGVQINITITGALDPYAVARQVETLLAKYKRGRGGASYNFG